LMVSSWGRCYGSRSLVSYTVNGTPVATVEQPGAREVVLPLHRPGAYKLTATLKDERGRTAAIANTLVTVG
jgi:hypothetical protein